MKSRKFYLIYSSLMFFFLTISVATNYAFGDLIWIDARDVSGGPPAYLANNISAWYNTLGTVADVTANAMADGLLLYRCYIFWSSRRWVVIFPALLWVSSIAMSIMMTIESAIPGANIFQGLPTSFSIPWLALTVSFNIIVTLMILGRLLATYWTIRKTLTPAFSETYINISATLIESALPFSALGICYLIAQVLNSNIVIAFSFVWGTFVVLAPQFIIYRIALGVAWTKETVLTTTPAMFFASNTDTEFDSEKSAGLSSGRGGTTLFGNSHMDLQSYKEGKL